MSKHSSLSKLLLTGLFAAGGMHFFNEYIFSCSLAKNILKPEKGHFYRYSITGDLYYEKFGNGDHPLLLIHDASFSGSSGFEWRECASHLSDRFCVYVIDLPGCGRSDKPSMIYTSFLMVQALSSFIREVIQKPCFIAAAGLSSSFALCMGHMYPDLMRDLIMINPPGLKSLRCVPDRRTRFLFHILNLPVLGTMIYNISVHRRNLDYKIHEQYFYNPFLVKNKYIDAFYEASHYRGGKSRHYQASLDGNYLNWDCRRILSLCQGPVHILYGEHLEKEKETALSYRRLKHDLSVSCIPQTKKLPHMEAPVPCAQKIKSILSVYQD